MGRELRRKEAKREGKSLKREQDLFASDPNRTFKNYLVTFVVVIAMLVILYLFLAIFITKEIDLFNDNNTNTVEEAANTENAILANATFKQKESTYFVYYYDFSDSLEDIDKMLANKLKDYTVYRVNTNDSLNSKYVDVVGNSNSTSLDDLKVSDPTLIQITNGNITLYLEGKANITNYYK